MTSGPVAGLAQRHVEPVRQNVDDPRHRHQETSAPRRFRPSQIRPGGNSGAGPNLQRACDGCETGSSCRGCADKALGTSLRPSAVPVTEVAAKEALALVGGGGGRPLDKRTRADMEDRLGGDFSSVRVHTGEPAARSAASVGALAYTIGDAVVLGEGAQAPETPAGRRVIAHELVHVGQQRRGRVAGTGTGAGLAVSDPGDSFEREAELLAERAMHPLPRAAGMPGPLGHGLRGPLSGHLQRAQSDPALQRQSAGMTGSTARSCGPEIGSQLTGVLTRIQNDFADPAISEWTREFACDNLVSLIPTAIMAWDILDLFLPRTGWLSAGPCAQPRNPDDPEDPATCGNTVEVDHKCWLAGTVNYAMYGITCKLCSDWHRSGRRPTTFSPGPIDPWSEGTMSRLVTLYNVLDRKGGGTDSPLAWATATYRGGPTARPAAASNRSSCPVGCGTPASRTSFDYAWPPIRGSLFH
jgi:hypothetical protein